MYLLFLTLQIDKLTDDKARVIVLLLTMIFLATPNTINDFRTERLF